MSDDSRYSGILGSPEEDPLLDPCEASGLPAEGDVVPSSNVEDTGFSAHQWHVTEVTLDVRPDGSSETPFVLTLSRVDDPSIFNADSGRSSE